MTYFGFLLQLLGIPILLLSALTLRDHRSGVMLPPSLSLLSTWLIVGLLMLIALLYTTPWDNYLVANGVWWYNPALVTGITIGWVPIEEYTFFILQPIMASLWLLFLARRLPIEQAFTPRLGLRKGATAFIGVLWLIAVSILISGWQPGQYLALILAWAFPAIAIQVGFGADILWHYRRLVLAALTSTTFYLCCADTLAIRSGTWTINPELTLGLSLGGILPIEEAVFFLITNILLTFGLVLGLARESASRLPLPLSSASVAYEKK